MGQNFKKSTTIKPLSGYNSSQMKDVSATSTTRQVLVDNLRTKIRWLLKEEVSSSSGVEADAMLTDILKESTNDDIVRFLCNELLLRKALEVMVARIRDNESSPNITVSPRKEELGELLFPKVAQIDSEQCAQITGMLLELDSDEIQRLIDSPSDLTLAVAKAKLEYIRYLEQNECSDRVKWEKHLPDGCHKNSKDVIGEVLFSLVSQEYPKDASQITGMFLEMDTSSVQKLLSSPLELKLKMELAYNAIHGT